MARYTDDSRERVRDAVDFVDLVGARTELRKAGVRRFEGRCPFHEERTPSFGIDPVEKLYHCFGCGVGGDVFKFVMETEGVGFGEALELLADRYNVTLERAEEDPRAAERRAARDRLYALLERTAAYYVRLLWESPEAAGAREYLAGRGLDEATLREFRVGYSPSAWERVVGASLRAGFGERELLDAGLAQRGSGGRLADRFRGRVMFPWADARGRVVGFGARALAEGERAKYLNSSENEIFHKGRLLYGVDLARAAAAKAASVVLVEGYTDVIALHQAGIRNVVGQMGTALTDVQAGELGKLAPAVLLCLDDDAAGQKAMARAAGVLQAAARGARGLELRAVRLPAGKDPADVVAQDGAAAAQELLAGSLPLARFQVEHALRRGETGSAEGRDRLLAEVAGVIRPLPPSVLREELVRLVAGRLALSEQLVAETLRAGAAAGPRTTPPAAVTSSAGGNGGASGGAEAGRRALDKRAVAEREFLALCLAFPSRGAQRLAAEELGTHLTADVSRRAARHLREHLDSPSSGLPEDDPELASAIAAIVVRARALEEGDPAGLDRAALHLDLARLDRDIAAARVSEAPVSDLAIERQRVLGELRRLSV